NLSPLPLALPFSPLLFGTASAQQNRLPARNTRHTLPNVDRNMGFTSLWSRLQLGLGFRSHDLQLAHLRRGEVFLRRTPAHGPAEALLRFRLILQPFVAHRQEKEIRPVQLSSATLPALLQRRGRLPVPTVAVLDYSQCIEQGGIFR